MSRVTKARKGKRIEILQRPLPFSYWPMYRGKRRFGLQSTVFVLDPWTIIRACIDRRCPEAVKPEAFSFLEQAQDFYKATTTAGIIASRPLLLYYCFMNLAKAFSLTVKQQSNFDQAQHGLSERLRPPQKELENAYLQVYKSPNARSSALNLFDEFMKAMTGSGLLADKDFDLPVLLPQVILGHRLWADAKDVPERFVAIHEIRFYEDSTRKEIWLSIDIFADDLTRLSVSHAKLLKEARLFGKFQEVKTEAKIKGRKLVRFEQLQPRNYSHRASDEVANLVADIKPMLWTTVASVSPYRRYYVYLAPVAEHDQILPQLLSIYAITYYLGSITRYRPHHFDKIIRSMMGARIEEFISSQPLQFIYLMASEFAEQEVTKPSIV
ncbi:MAG: YaaC family protein [Victivallales bacterium]